MPDNSYAIPGPGGEAKAPKPDVQDWKGSPDAVADPKSNHGPGYDVPKIDPPKPVGGGGASGEVAADTEAFKVVASNIASLIDPLKEAQSRLSGIDVRPGAFAQAFALKDQVSGPSGLKVTMTTVTSKLIETLTDVQNGLLKMALDYETTEEANKAKADAVQMVMPDVAADIQGILSGKS